MRSFAFLVTLISTLWFAGVASAEGFGISSCSSPGPHINFLNIFVSTSNQAQIISCEADSLDSPIGLVTGIFSVSGVRVIRLRVVDNHPTQNISCSLNAVTQAGVTLVTAQVTSTGTGDQEISGGPSGPLTVNPGVTTDARVILSCMMPPTFNGAGSGIVDINSDPITVF